jgi:transketolase
MLDPKRIRKIILEAAYKSQNGHIPSCFSAVDIIIDIYKTLKIDPKNPKDPNRDYFVLSKGHAACALYAVLGELGFFDTQEFIDTYCQKGSRFGAHPDMNKVPGVEASTGSLGHGLPYAVGIAMGLKIQGKPNRVVCLIGDGESQEGSCYEAISAKYQFELGNLEVRMDKNGSHETYFDTHTHWKTYRGYPIERLEDPSWHHRAPTKEEYDEMNKDLDTFYA